MNDSTSAISPAWPTRWPKNSFTGAWTWLLAGFIAGLFIVVFFFSIGSTGTEEHQHLPRSTWLSGCSSWSTLCSSRCCSGRFRPFRSSRCASWAFACRSARRIVAALIGAAAMFVVANGSATLIDYLAHSQHPQDIVQIFKHLHDPTHDHDLRALRGRLRTLCGGDALPRLLLQPRPALRRLLGRRGYERRALRNRARRPLRGDSVGAWRHRSLCRLLPDSKRLRLDDLALALQRGLDRLSLGRAESYLSNSASSGRYGFGGDCARVEILQAVPERGRLGRRRRPPFERAIADVSSDEMDRCGFGSSYQSG